LWSDTVSEEECSVGDIELTPEQEKLCHEIAKREIQDCIDRLPE
jgi:hypothetical protein